MVNFKKVGQRLKEYRLQRALTQKELAKKSRIAPGTISKIENGSESLTITQLLRLHIALKPSKKFPDWVEELTK